MTTEMRRLCVVLLVFAFAAPAASAASTPRFALYVLQTDLAHASHNTYGDVAVKPRAALAGKGTLVRCATWCRFGAGWLAFKPGARLAPADVSAAAVRYTKHKGWTVRLTLTRSAASKWTRLARTLKAGAKLRGVPDVLVVVAGGQVAAAPFSTQVAAAGGVLTLTGFSRASAKALQIALK
jgi:hypothetical protein